MTVQIVKRMGLFSQRKELKPLKVPLQKESMDGGLRNGLWSSVLICLFEKVEFDPYSVDFRTCTFYQPARHLWHNYFKEPIDTLPTDWSDFVNYIRGYFFDCEWYEVYDFIEFLFKCTPENSANHYKNFSMLVNNVLERDNAAYRLVDGKIVDLTDDTTIKTIEEAVQQTVFLSASEHIKTAITLLYDRSSPDYRNAIKESISGVEAASIELTGDNKATLGQALKVLETKHQLHPALKEGFAKIYGYTSDASGIRHALIDTSSVTKADAQFFLSICSSFINYLIAKS